jgi:hypothetical protein
MASINVNPYQQHVSKSQGGKANSHTVMLLISTTEKYAHSTQSLTTYTFICTPIEREAGEPNHTIKYKP